MDKLLALRGLAALSVVVYHAQNYVRPHLNQNVTLLGMDLTWLFTPSGGLAVTIFFVLSGYLMFKAFASGRYKQTVGGVINFYFGRAKRIFPLYFFLIFLFILFCTPKVLEPQNFHVIASLLTFTYNGDPLFVQPFWSLSVEVQFYVILPLLFFLTTKLSRSNTVRALICLGFISLGMLARSAYAHPADGGLPSSFEQLAMSIDAFMIGGAGAFITPVIKRRFRVILEKYRSYIGYASVALGIAMIPMASLFAFKLAPMGFEPFAALVISLFSLLFIVLSEVSTSGEYRAPQAFTLLNTLRHPSRLPEFIGAMSFGIYLWHAPIIGQSLAFPITNEYHLGESLVRSVLIILVSTLAAYISYRLVESAPINPTLTKNVSRIAQAADLWVERLKKSIRRKRTRPQTQPQPELGFEESPL